MHTVHAGTVVGAETTCKSRLVRARVGSVMICELKLEVGQYEHTIASATRIAVDDENMPEGDSTGCPSAFNPKGFARVESLRVGGGCTRGGGGGTRGGLWYRGGAVVYTTEGWEVTRRGSYKSAAGLDYKRDAD